MSGVGASQALRVGRLLALALVCSCHPPGDRAAHSGLAAERGAAQRSSGVTRPRIELAELDSSGEPGVVLRVLKEQLKHAQQGFAGSKHPPYFLAYQVTERKLYSIAASDGGIVVSDERRLRVLDVDLRIGDHQLDSTQLPNDFDREWYRGARLLPLNDDVAALQNGVWLATNERYEQALENWATVRAAVAREQHRSSSDALTREEPVRHVESVQQPPSIDVSAWQERLARVSALASRFPRITESSVVLEVNHQVRYFVNSDGSEIQTVNPQVRLSMSAGAVASDGLPLQQFDSAEAVAIGQLPEEAEIAARFQRVLVDVERLLDASLVEPYVGPAILDGRAAGVFFHEVFGHRVEGHRQDDKTEGQTFAGRIGQRVMPKHFNLYDDPRARSLDGKWLSGYYSHDDEGVPAQRAVLVEGGVLRTFLLSRSGAPGFEQSNGHGRRSPGHEVVARQANLIIEPEETVSAAELKGALLSEVRRQGLPYGLRFSQITGGFTNTQRYDAQAFKVMPLMVYKVYPDGREELVRGVDIEGTPLTALSKIALAGDDFQVFNGVCGAESGWVPVSATSPSILVSQIEVARQELTDLRPPILPDPTTADVNTGREPRSGNAARGAR